MGGVCFLGEGDLTSYFVSGISFHKLLKYVSISVYKKLNLETYISIKNMHLFDSNCKIKKYVDQYEIIDDFYVNNYF